MVHVLHWHWRTVTDPCHRPQGNIINLHLEHLAGSLFLLQISKLIWFVLLVVGSSMTFYALYNVSSDYLAFEISTKVTLETVSSQEFPAVTVCNHNRLRKNMTVFDVVFSKFQLFRVHCKNLLKQLYKCEADPMCNCTKTSNPACHTTPTHRWGIIYLNGS